MGPVGAPTRAPADPRLTVVYLICLPQVGPKGYRLVVAFGAGGCETMVLGQLLRDDWSGILRDLVLSDRPRLVLGTLRVPERFPYPFLVYDSSELDPRIVADVELRS